jgi:hypothetical protein
VESWHFSLPWQGEESEQFKEEGVTELDFVALEGCARVATHLSCGLSVMHTLISVFLSGLENIMMG